MSLRARLLVGLVALVAAGLVTVGAITYAEQRSFLLQRVDQEVTAATPRVSHDLDGSNHGAPPAGFGQGGGYAPGGFPAGESGGPPNQSGVVPPSLPPSTYSVQRSPTGQAGTPQVFDGPALPAPKLPANVPLSTSGHTRPITVGSVGSSGLSYRVYAVAMPNGAGTTILAVPLREIDQTLNSLLEVEALVGGAVLLALGLLALLVIRVGLRPLERIGVTAGAIADGDLSRRVEPATARTEVGRLGLALNGMLAQIERAFTEREASAERLRRFLADASHELRTPLASIRGYAELFRIGAVSNPTDLKKAMTRIEAEAARMGVLVDDLLTLARLDELPDVTYGPVDMTQLARDAVADARAIAADRQIELHSARPALVLGDPHHLRQVIGNLMRNAIVHTPAGSPIEVEVTEGDNGQVAVTVRDHGPGLPADADDAIFERFWRADPGRGRGKAGAGLGLAIVASVVEAHGGTATAANSPDGGALFVVRIPALDPPRTSEVDRVGDPGGSGDPGDSGDSGDPGDPGGSGDSGDSGDSAETVGDPQDAGDPGETVGDPAPRSGH
ncbi:MAG TPA: HAMP domain-containing sensor histidine kinase [Solirubrobacteraceae bacterium]|jgi:two-component system OmpR family sensor kinase|nr:HAMP domain-containing sensor histidine kinase [Solirubrobacteraceae bacterium]